MLKTIDEIKDPVEFFKNEANKVIDPEISNVNAKAKYQTATVAKKVKTSKT